jgi:hypothetical protein
MIDELKKMYRDGQISRETFVEMLEKLKTQIELELIIYKEN